MDLLHGEDIGKLLNSTGPIVKCVLLRASPAADDAPQDNAKKPAAADDSKKTQGDEAPPERVVLTDLIDEIEIDTTPKKNMVTQVLGGPFTFVGQYEEEGTILMARRDEEGLVLNPHQLQPPFTDCGVRGDVLVMKVAETEEVLDEEEQDGDEVEEKAVVVPTNEEFFLDYTKEEYVAFASRTDVVAPEIEHDEEEEEEEFENEEGDDDDEYVVGEDEEDDEDDQESQVAMMNLIMAQVLRRFHEENGRGPDTRELLELRSALAEKIGVEVPDIQGADWEAEAEVEPESPQKGKRTVEDDAKVTADDDGHARKRVKFSQETTESDDVEESTAKEDDEKVESAKGKTA